MKKTIFVYFWLLGFCAYGQTDTTTSLLDLLDEKESVERISNAFKSPRVIMGHSMEMLGEGMLDFRILHRFGVVNRGIEDLFGLDNASMRMSFDYGISPNLTVGIGRSTFGKEMDGFLKYRLLWQSTGSKNIPFSLIWLSGLTMNTLSMPFSEPNFEPTLARRMGYYHQLILGRKFNTRFTAQLSPTLVHTNTVSANTPNDLFALGFGGRLKLSNRFAFVWDYFYVFNHPSKQVATNPLSVGFDIETGGHVFQLHFSNSVGMNERAFISTANTDWLKAEIRFGFNLSRVFQIKK